MPKCPKCNAEINEDVMVCPACNCDLQEPTEGQLGDAEPEETALLMTAKDELQANIVESLLDAYDIPLRRAYKGNDSFGRVFMGLTVNGIDLFVPKSKLEEAAGIIENEMPEEVEVTNEGMDEAVEELEMEPDDEPLMEKLEQKYENRRRIRAWIALLLFIPGIAWLLVIAISWLIKMFL